MAIFDKYPYTNFHELNLSYFIVHFREIFAQWAELYDTLTTWKDATNAELLAWKEEQESAMQQWETALLADLAQWKQQTHLDIFTWEANAIAALDEWKTAFQTLFDSTFSNLTDIKTDAEDARDAAQAAQAAAEAAQAAAELAASTFTTDPTLSISGKAADAKATGDAIENLDTKVGDGFTELVPIETTITFKKVFASRSVGSEMAFSDNDNYHYIPLNVLPGETYSVKTYFSSGAVANRYYVYFTDAEGVVKARRYLEADYSGSTTLTVVVPNNASIMYVQGYSTEALIVNRMSIKEQVPLSITNKINSIDTEITGVESSITSIESDITDLNTDISDLHNLISYNQDEYTDTRQIYNVRVFNNTLTVNRMTTSDGSVSTSSAYCYTRAIPIYNAVFVYLPGYAYAINVYDSYNMSSARFIRNIVGYGEHTYIVVNDSTYPMYIRIGARRLDSDELTTEDLETIASSIRISSLFPQPDFASFSMFNKAAITGCSWDAGTVYDSSDGHVTHTGIGWAEVLARRSGVQISNFAIGGTSIRTWYNEANSNYSFKSLLETTAVPCYILTHGNSNDANAERGFVINDSGYNPLIPSTDTYYIGTIADITNWMVRDDYPCTFYGYMGRVIEMIQEHAPHARIIISSPDTTIITTTIRSALRTACKEIADHYHLPYMDLETDPYYDIYTQLLKSDHPTAPTYSGWALAMERLLSKTIEKYYTYFSTYSGVQSSVSVTWEPVELEVE